MAADDPTGRIPPAQSAIIITSKMTRRERCQALGQAWLEEFRVTAVVVHQSGSPRGSARFGTRQITVPPPTTVLRLSVLAHEIGHIVLGHSEVPLTTIYVQEFEAQLFSLALLARDGVPVEDGAVSSMRSYVWSWVEQTLKAGGSAGLGERRPLRHQEFPPPPLQQRPPAAWIDPTIAAWAGRAFEGWEGRLTRVVARHNRSVPVEQWLDHHGAALARVRTAGLEPQP